MIDNKWFCEPDELREIWCFLNLHVNDKDIIEGWEIGYGNPIVMMRKINHRKTNEKDIIKELLIQLYNCRKENILLITYTNNVLPILRTRILFLDIKEASLYGIKHISVEEILYTYFLYDANQELIDKNKKITFLWKLLLRIGPLLPRGVIQ